MKKYRLFAFTLGVLVASGCFREEGLSYDQLTIEALNDSGATVTRFPKCFTMPILHGSVVEERHAIEGGAVILIHATDAVIEVGFEGVIDSGTSARSITLDDLKAGYTETLPIESTSGARFSVRLSRGCR